MGGGDDHALRRRRKKSEAAAVDRNRKETVDRVASFPARGSREPGNYAARAFPLRYEYN